MGIEMVRERGEEEGNCDKTEKERENGGIVMLSLRLRIIHSGGIVDGWPEEAYAL